MFVREVMSRVPNFLRMEQSILEAARLMRDENVGFLPVCDADKKVLGALTDRDVVVRIVADERSSSTAVRDVMSPDVVTVGINDDVTQAEQLMEEHQIARIMCVDDSGALMGVIGMADLARRDAEHVRAVVSEVKSDHAGAPN